MTNATGTSANTNQPLTPAIILTTKLNVILSLFPDHIRAMVLDGAIDPSLDLEGLRAGQAKGFETELRSFLDDCAARTSCAFHEGGRVARSSTR